MKNTRRIFLRNMSLTATGFAVMRSSFDSVKENNRRPVISCGPSKVFALTGTITSVQSGKWSDPSTWGGRVPASSDTPLIASGHTIDYDVDLLTIAGVNVGSGGTLAFNTSRSVTLQSTANVVIEGILQMRPGSPSVIQTLRFVNVDENKFAGGGMNVLDTDVGLWVMNAGQLDLLGTNKTSWTRATGSIAAGVSGINVADATGWQAGDEISIAPTEPISAGAVAITGFGEHTISSIAGSTIRLNKVTDRTHPMVNNQWTAEVMNLTRNVRIEGTPSGRAHIFIRSTSIQSIKYTAIRYMGPRKDRNGDGIKELVAGRYGMHFHHCMDGSRTSSIEGNVIRDNGNHSYVPHISHGIRFLGNIAYNVTEIAFWYDPGDPTHDVIYDHNIVAMCKFVPGSLNMNAQDAPTFSSSGFSLNSGDGNICRNNVVVGGSVGDIAEGGGYNWEAVLNEGVWIFTDNMSHNNANGLRVWQNSTRNHVIENYTAYHNESGIFHGAYANSYTYNGGILYGNKMTIKAASANSNRVRVENLIIDGAHMIDNGIELIHSPLAGERPVMIRNVTIRGCNVSAIQDTVEPNIHSADIIQCNVEGPLVLNAVAVNGETLRVQPLSGQPYQITKGSTTNITPFAASLWGNGKGLKGEYFNSTDFTNPAFTRIDSNVSFTEWSTGVHHAITSNVYSVRWTGQIQPQFSDTYTFYLGSGGGHRLWIDNKLILDSWVEHYPAAYQATPIALIAGQKYDIRLEYFNKDGGTGMGLFWTSKSLPLEYVPQSQLYSDAGAPPPVNQPPVANAGADIAITLPVNSITLDGTASKDPDGSIVSYQWAKVSGPAQSSIANAAAASTIVNGLVQGTYTFRLTVTNNKGATGTDDVVVTVSPAVANQPPIADAGSNMTIALPVNTVTLDGTASKDPDGTFLYYAWAFVSGPSQYSIVAPNSATTVVNNLVQGIYVFRLTVTDNKGATAASDVTVTVNAAGAANKPPVANAGSDIAVSLPILAITLDGSLSTDADGKIVAYKWSRISGPSACIIVNPDAATTAVMNLAEGTYVFRLQVMDDKGAIGEDYVNVVVKAAQTPPNVIPLNVIVSPNPTIDYFTLRISSNVNSPVTVYVFDNYGKLVMNMPGVSNNATIKLGYQWPAGTYAVFVKQGAQQKAVTLLKV